MNDEQEISTLLLSYQNGNKREIYKKLNKILKRRKDDFKLRYNVAVIEQELNLNKEARSNYKLIINSQKNLKAMINLYSLDIKEQKYEDALKLINKILEIKQDLNFVIKDKAFVYLKMFRIKNSIDICNKLLVMNKKDTNVLNILGLCFLYENKYTEATKIFKEILIYDNKNIAALNSLGRLNHEIRNSKDAEKFFLEALEINPNSLEVLNNIAGFYREEGKYKKGISLYLRALKLYPNNPFILNNLSKSYFDINDLSLAKKYSLAAFQLDKIDGNIQKILSFIYLREQNYIEAWKYFDGRLKINDFVKKNKSIIKIQDKLLTSNYIDKNKKILILREQGVGDEILYATMYKDVLEDWPNVQIECEKRLLNLFKNSFRKYSARFVESGKISNNDKNLKAFDNVLYAGSLGKYYRKKIFDFDKLPYLLADKNKIAKQQLYFNQFNNKKNIGISWRSFNNRYSNEKSLTLFDFEKLFKIKNCNIINLQYGNVSEEISKFEKETGFEIFTNNEIDLFNDLDNLAALLKNIDIFITISNSTAHLAGALGIKTFLIKPSNHALFHYWNQPNERSPWYNSIQLIDRENLNNVKFIENLINI